MACNNQSKKMDAFYHNQKKDYDSWLRKNTTGQSVLKSRPLRTVSLGTLVAMGLSLNN